MAPTSLAISIVACSASDPDGHPGFDELGRTSPERLETLFAGRVRDPVSEVLRGAQMVAHSESGDEPPARDPVERDERRDENGIGQQPDPRDERSDRHPIGCGGNRTEKRHRAQCGAVRATNRPKVVEGEHAVEPQTLGEHRGIDRRRVVAKRREGHSYSHGSMTPERLSARAMSAAPTAPASSPSAAPTIETGGRWPPA